MRKTNPWHELLRRQAEQQRPRRRSTHARLKLYCEQTGQTMADFVDDLVHERLGDDER